VASCELIFEHARYFANAQRRSLPYGLCDQAPRASGTEILEFRQRGIGKPARIAHVEIDSLNERSISGSRKSAQNGGG
jgi:hypothetical protein